MGPILDNKALIEILDKNKEDKKRQFDNLVFVFTNMIDCAFNDATYDISSDGKFISIEGHTESAPTEYPKELLKSISDEIIRLRGFDQVTIYVYPGDYSNSSRVKIELVPHYEPTVRGAIVDIVDRSYTEARRDEAVVDRIIRGTDPDTTAVIKEFGMNHLM